MDEKIKQIAQKISDFWKALDKKKKIIIISAASAVVIILIVVVTALNTTKYELLTSGLTEKEASQVYNAISAQKIPVKIEGTNIYVQKGTADKMRMMLAEQGLPEGDLTYDIYSSGTNFAETDKDKEIKQLQQIQNRLQDTIETIPGVKQAIVNIAKSNEGTYVLETDKVPTTASVKLTLEEGTTLTKKQINGIVQLVKNSVAGLTAENITVADSDGTQLNTDNNGLDDTSEQMLLKSRYESAVKDKLSQMLEKVFGDDNFNVTVNADIDFSTKSTVTTSYTSGVVAYTTRSSETTYSGSSLATGTAGVSGAQPAYPNAGVSGVSQFSNKANETSSMLVGSVQEQIQKKGGQLSKLTVAVILNSRNPAAASVDTEELRQQIANAAGTTIENVSVGQMSFSSASVPENAARGWPLPLNANNLLLYIIIFGVLIILIGTTLLFILLSRRRKRREEEEQEALEQAQAEAMEALQDEKAQPIKSIEETIEESQNNSVKREIENFTDKKPELVAQILKNWLKD
ncbi:MAG: flagellar basal-body MS-ring/collar protein FliF [[Clostridium] cellulosi]|nr:MAG: flagellar M-ring protein FliF [[Clostridium] cellulosi]